MRLGNMYFREKPLKETMFYKRCSKEDTEYVLVFQLP